MTNNDLNKLPWETEQETAVVLGGCFARRARHPLRDCLTATLCRLVLLPTHMHGSHIQHDKLPPFALWVGNPALTQPKEVNHDQQRPE